MSESVNVSIVIPVFNETENIRPLCEALRDALSKISGTVEVILVDDGSTDDSLRLIREEEKKDGRFYALPLEANRGQARAMSEGFRRSRGEVVVSLDADLQNDPADLPLLLEEIGRGFEVVCGWRKDRIDSFVGKIIPSRIFNLLVRALFGVPIHDVSCTLRAYRREAALSLDLAFDDLSFIPILLHLKGYRVTERIVRHHGRRYGQAKYDSPARFVYTLKRLRRLWSERRAISAGRNPKP